MGIMDKLGGLFGGNKTNITDSVAPPSTVLRENGIDPSNLEFTFNQDGSVGITGTAASSEEIDRINELVAGITGVTGVKSNVTVATSQAEPAAAPEQEETPAEPPAGGQTYTVQSGDSLWKIAAEMYGSGDKYMKIFEANTHILENPDKIFPGQELVIPDLED